MNYKVNVLKIDEAWSSCNYKLRVFVEEGSFTHHFYIKETLKKWFGEVEFFSTNRRDFSVPAEMYLCILKK